MAVGERPLICQPEPAAQQTDPKGDYKAGTLLDSRSFTQSDKYDNNWYSFGPLDPKEGEYIEEFKGYVFKVISEGVQGNDGNLFHYFFSRGPNVNIAIEGANAFGYEWTFRMPSESNAVCHLYPYITDDVVSIQQFNFDWDDDVVFGQDFGLKHSNFKLSVFHNAADLLINCG